MSVIARRIASSPVRTTSSTWEYISDLVCQDDDLARKEFDAVAGLSAACISEETFKNDAFVVIGKGSRLRVYCLYGEDAISGDNRAEDPLVWKPTENEWKAYVPCTPEDFEWMASSISKKSPNFFAYNVEEGFSTEMNEGSDMKTADSRDSVVSIDIRRFKEL